MKILLIAGHGAGDPGAVGAVNGKSYKEAELTREVTENVRKVLSQYADVTVYPTSRNAYTDYQNGVLAANAGFKNYGYVLEIHFNAASADSGNGKVKGAEAYVTTSESGITVEETVLKKMAALGYTNRGVKKKNWSVISAAKAAGVSSCLLEVCFVDDADDMALYEKTKVKTAEAIALGVAEGFGLMKEEKETMTVEKAIEKLAAAGIINTPAYWKIHHGDIAYFDELLIKMAEYIG